MEEKKQTTLIAGGNARFMNEKTGLFVVVNQLVKDMVLLEKDLQ